VRTPTRIDVWREERRERRSILGSGTKLYSQNQEELIVRDWFRDRRNGVFVDVGAGDWQVDSTTYYLEHHLGWSGLAVDARAGLASGFAEHRPRTRFIHHLVTDHGGTDDRFFEAGWLSTTDRDHLTAHAIEPATIRVTAVPTITLDELLDRCRITRVDFLSMDLELGESAALRGFDIRRFRPELVCVEAGPSQRETLATYFADNGYRRIERYLRHDGVNWWFTPAT
jgi:hypothetical protein